MTGYGNGVVPLVVWAMKRLVRHGRERVQDFQTAGELDGSSLSWTATSVWTNHGFNKKAQDVGFNKMVPSKPIGCVLFGVWIRLIKTLFEY